MATYAADFGNPSTFLGQQYYAQETQPQELQEGSQDNEWELLYTEDGLHAYWYNNITQESRWANLEKEAEAVQQGESAVDTEAEYYPTEGDDDDDDEIDWQTPSSKSHQASSVRDDFSNETQGHPTTNEFHAVHADTSDVADEKQNVMAKPPNHKDAEDRIAELESERDAAVERSMEYKARLQVAESQIMAIFESGDKVNTDSSKMWHRRASQLLKTQQSLTGILATKTREIARKQVMIDSLQQELEETEEKYANMSVNQDHNRAMYSPSQRQYQASMLKMKSENQDKMNQMIQNMTTQFEREKRSVVEEYTGQLDALRRTLHSERENYHLLYTQNQNLESLKNKEAKYMLEIEQKKQRDLVEELNHAKEELSKKEAELQASQMGSETDLSKSGAESTEEALAKLEASLNAQHEKEMKTVNEKLDELNSTVQQKDVMLNQLRKEIGELKNKLKARENIAAEQREEANETLLRRLAEYENGSKVQLEALKASHDSMIQELKNNHQNELDDVRQQMREEASSALKQLTDLTKLERDMEIEALKAKHQAELLQVRGEKTKQERKTLSTRSNQRSTRAPRSTIRGTRTCRRRIQSSMWRKLFYTHTRMWLLSSEISEKYICNKNSCFYFQ